MTDSVESLKDEQQKQKDQVDTLKRQPALSNRTEGEGDGETAPYLSAIALIMLLIISLQVSIVDTLPGLYPALVFENGENLLKEGDSKCHYPTRPMSMGHDWGSCMNDQIQINSNNTSPKMPARCSGTPVQNPSRPLSSFCARESGRVLRGKGRLRYNHTGFRIDMGPRTLSG